MPRDDEPRPGLILEVEATDLDRDGCGLARWQGWVIVVPDLLPGELARIQLLQRQRSRWRSRRLELIHASSERRRPPCILASVLGPGERFNAGAERGRTKFRFMRFVSVFTRPEMCKPFKRET